MDRHTLNAILLFAAIFLVATSGSSGPRDGKVQSRAAFVTGAVAPTPSPRAPLFVFPTLETRSVFEKNMDGEKDNSFRAVESAVNSSSHPALGAFMRKRWTEPPALHAQSAIIADVSSGASYFSLRSDSRWPIASITKLMTAVAAYDLIERSAALTVVEEDFEAGGNAFTKELKAGDAYRTEDMRTIMLLTSSNEIAEAFARTAGRDMFMEHMNAKAKEWGLHKTYFTDPTGVAAANQSTAEELVSLAMHIRSEYPGIFETTQKQTITVTELNSAMRHTFSNINIFAGEPSFLGGKTGFTPEAGANLLSLFSYQGSPFIIIVLGTEDRFGETSRLLDWFIHDFIPSN